MINKKYLDKEFLLKALENTNENNYYVGGYYLGNSLNLELTEKDIENLILKENINERKLIAIMLDLSRCKGDKVYMYHDMKQGKAYVQVKMYKCTKIILLSSDGERGMEGDVFDYKLRKYCTVGYFEFDPMSSEGVERMQRMMFGS